MKIGENVHRTSTVKFSTVPTNLMQRDGMITTTTTVIPTPIVMTELLTVEKDGSSISEVDNSFSRSSNFNENDEHADEANSQSTSSSTTSPILRSPSSVFSSSENSLTLNDADVNETLASETMNREPIGAGTSLETSREQ